MREVSARHPRASTLLAALDRAHASGLAVEYLRLLQRAGVLVDAWTTTYVHVLDAPADGEHPVLTWVRATGLRPVLSVLSDEGERAAFLVEYERALQEKYPVRSGRVIFEFERVFAVAHRLLAS